MLRECDGLVWCVSNVPLGFRQSMCGGQGGTRHFNCPSQHIFFAAQPPLSYSHDSSQNGLPVSFSTLHLDPELHSSVAQGSTTPLQDLRHACAECHCLHTHCRETSCSAGRQCRRRRIGCGRYMSQLAVPGCTVLHGVMANKDL